MRACRFEVREAQGSSTLRFWADSQLLGERPLPQAELDAWIDQVERDYRTLGVDLLALGRRLHDWLDGPTERWIEQARKPNGELAMHIDTAARLRHLPWELLADAAGHLCANPLRPFTPVRRAAAMQKTWEQANRPLRVLFMACSPLDVRPVLEFEKEEAWILEACLKSKEQIELVVEESGALEGLTDQLRAFGPGYFDVVHLSGHAEARDGKAVFLAEDAHGRRAPCNALQLAQAFEGAWPKLLFLSGCETGRATDAGAAPSLCEAMAAAGAPAVLGWALKVGDTAASALAAALYSNLAVGKRIDESVARSRQQLFEDGFAHWHLLRLYGNDTPLAATVTSPRTRGRERLVIRPADKEFLDAKAPGKGEVCPRERFVGRRRALQRSLRVLASRQQDADYHEGVLISGMGGLGKSSLAARLCERMQGHQRLVLAGLVDEPKLNFLINDHLGSPEVLEIQNQPGLPLKHRLKSILAGPLASTPVLFVFDDFEQNLEPDASGGYRCRAEPLEVLRAVLAAIRETSSESRVINTSRYRFPLLAPLSLYPEGLESLRGADLDKKLGSLDALSPTAKTDAALRGRAIERAAGNPRLLEWLERVLSVASEDAAAIFAALEGKAEEFRENVLVDELLQRQTPEFRRLLAHLALHALPIDRDMLVATVGGETIGGISIGPSLVRGVELGLVESAPQAVSGESKYFVSPIVSPRLDGDLTADERTDAQGRAARRLHDRWKTKNRESEEELLEMIRLAIEIRDSGVAVDAAHFLAGLWQSRSRFRDAEELCQRLLAVFNDFRIAHSLARAEEVLGKTELALTHYESALAACPPADANASYEVLRHRASLTHNFASLLADRGSISRAVELWQQTLDLEKRVNDEQGMAATFHQLASVLSQQGQNHRAMELFKRSLAIQSRIGDVRGTAATLHQMSGVLSRKGDVQHAMNLLQQAFEIEERLGDIQGKSATLHEMGRLLAGDGETDHAMALWRQSLQLAEEIGDVESKAITLNQIANVAADRGFVKDAVKLWQESLRLNEQIGNLQGWAVTLANLGGLEHKAGNKIESRKLSLDAVNGLAAARAWPDLAIVLANLAVIHEAKLAPYLAQALWLVVRLQMPSFGAAYARVLLGDIGAGNDTAPLLAAAGLWLARRQRGEQKEERQDLAQQMLAACAAERGIPPEDVAAWAEREGLLDPARFLPRLDRALEALVGDDGWLFDRCLVELPLGGAEPT